MAFNEQDRPVGFLGVEGEMIEMLFLDPAVRGNGLGRSMMDYAVKNFGAGKVNVNEQNRGAKGFYEHMGFSVCRRTDTDDQGRPYPILYMELKRA